MGFWYLYFLNINTRRMFGLVILLLAAIIGYSSSSSLHDATCTDGQGVYILETYMPCSLLVEAEDPRNVMWGMFEHREWLCETSVHQCCRTCRHILRDTDPETCTDHPRGVRLMETNYDCDYLLQPDLPGNDALGIYQARVATCSKGTHQCCHSCQVVYNEEGISVHKTTPAAPTTITAVPITTITTTATTKAATTATATTKAATTSTAAATTKTTTAAASTNKAATTTTAAASTSSCNFNYICSFNYSCRYNSCSCNYNYSYNKNCNHNDFR